MKYRFVKLHRKGSKESGTWFFNPRSEEQVVEHFNKIFGGEIKATVREYFENKKCILEPHLLTPFGRGVQAYQEIYDESFMIAAMRLENETINERLNSFNKGQQMFFDNGVAETRMTKDDEIVDELELDALEYPVETQYRLEDVRYIKWNMPDLRIKGVHWYAKIGNKDIVDEDGNMKWNTKEEAEAAAKKFVNQLNFYRYGS